MKIQLAYRFTGENESEIKKLLEEISDILKEKGHEVYCPILNPDRPKEKRDLFLDTLERIESADALLALVKSEEKSEGMLMEIGHALANGIKLILVINNGVKNTHLREFADQIIEFENIDNLIKELENVK